MIRAIIAIIVVLHSKFHFLGIKISLVLWCQGLCELRTVGRIIRLSVGVLLIGLGLLYVRG